VRGLPIVLEVITKRLAAMIVLLFAISIMVFLIIRLIPGSPVAAILGTNASDPNLAKSLTHQLGLNDPLPVQYGHWIGSALGGNFGYSYAQQMPVSKILAQNLPWTLELTLAGLAFSLVFGSALGILAAVNRNTSWDTAAMFVSLACLSMPSFWLGFLLLALFGVALHWFPVFGTTSLRGLPLPAVTLGLAVMGITARFVRSSIIDTAGHLHVLTARAKGLPRSVVFRRHILRNSLLPILTVVGLQVGSLLSGAVIIENVFSRPGIGRVLVTAILGKDYLTVQAVVLIIAAMYAVTNLLVDLSYPLLDPRIARR
jgi:ABC-type dipeptide/oligopeptide/nickel transport system permease component